MADGRKKGKWIHEAGWSKVCKSSGPKVSLQSKGNWATKKSCMRFRRNVKGYSGMGTDHRRKVIEALEIGKGKTWLLNCLSEVLCGARRGYSVTVRELQSQPSSVKVEHGTEKCELFVNDVGVYKDEGKCREFRTQAYRSFSVWLTLRRGMKWLQTNGKQTG